MRDVGGIYSNGKGRRYIAAYNFYKDVFKMIPQSLRAERVAHFSYEFGRREGGVDVFMIPKEIRPEKIIKIVTGVRPLNGGFEIIKNTERKKRKLYVSREDLGGIRERYNINIQILGGLPEEVKQEIIDFTNTDIYEFCDGVEARTKENPETIFLPKIVSNTQIRRIHPKRVLTTGKPEFVPSCILEANIDFGQGCISRWIGGENPDFDGEFFTDYYLFKSGGCLYCYAERNHKAFPKTIYEFDKERLIEELMGAFIIQDRDDKRGIPERRLGRPVEILRFGKRTESYTPFTKGEFIQTLEACVETGTRGVIPTKFLNPDQEILRLLRRTKSSVLFSISGLDQFEVGAFLQECDNEERFERAITCHENRINTLIYLNVANPLNLSEKEWKIIEEARKYGIKTQILPTRFKKPKVMREITGMIKEIIVGEPDLFDETAGNYICMEGATIPRIESMDSALISLIGDNKGRVCMCHHDDKKTYCGGCGVAEGTIGKTKHINKRNQSRRGKKKGERKYWDTTVKLKPEEY